MYIILKRFVFGADIWVAKLNDADPIYTYDTLEEAEASIVELQSQYPNNDLKISTQS